MTEALDTKSKQLTDSLKNEGFNIFFAKNTLDSDNVTEVFWDENEDSKQFFEIAKREGVKTIVAEVKVLEKDMLNLDSEDEESINPEILKQLKTEISRISKYAGKVGSYKFSWMKDGIKYSLMETTEWFEEFASIIGVFKENPNSEIKPALKIFVVWQNKQFIVYHS